jgi:hypothetical protein
MRTARDVLTPSHRRVTKDGNQVRLAPSLDPCTQKPFSGL